MLSALEVELATDTLGLWAGADRALAHELRLSWKPRFLLVIGGQRFGNFSGLSLDLRKRLVVPRHLQYGLLKVMVSLVDENLLMLPVQQMFINVAARSGEILASQGGERKWTDSANAKGSLGDLGPSPRVCENS